MFNSFTPSECAIFAVLFLAAVWVIVSIASIAFFRVKRQFIKETFNELDKESTDLE